MRTLYYNGQIYTNDQFLEAFIVENEQFVFVGTDEEAFQQEYDQMIDLRQQFVCAGFNDSHMHVLNYGNYLLNVGLDQHTDSLEDMCQHIKSFITLHQVKKGKWIIARGWNHDYFQDVQRMPNRFDLDAISHQHPICATRVCGHCLVVNSYALKQMGMDQHPDGIFYDDALEMVYSYIPAPSKEEIKEMLIEAMKQLNRNGITSAQTDDYCTFRSVPYEVIHEAYRELATEGKLTVRINEQANFTNVDDFQAFLDKGYRTGWGDIYFKIGPLKILADGSLGARTAYLSRPYANDDKTCGMLCLSEKEIEKLVMCACKNKMQVAIHAIGDRCLDVVLDAYEKALALYPKEDHRLGIVHCQITRSDQLERMQRLHVHVYAQTIFLDYDIRIVEECVGKELAATSYSWKTLLDHGVCVSNGSDCPVELPNVLHGIQCALTRKDLSENFGPYISKEAFTMKDALDSYTISGAYASFEENIKGRIQSHYLADFVILDKNPFVFDVQTVHIIATYMDGHCVYHR